MTLNNSMSITPSPPGHAKRVKFEHGSVLGGKTRAARVSSQWKSTRMRLVVDRRRLLLFRESLLFLGEGLLLVCRSALLIGNRSLFVCLRRLGFGSRLFPVGFRGLVLGDCPLLVSILGL